ncbi:hypothetical protein PB2503_01787 [Parvularcula bermudensis HTCC2503]|uniref:Metallophosphoesterase n=1 Tax=Parvularcula bermudensis (strain ATCC BAA-594 / HTCC2503 / KCTC 12087) TaxID=314260 RepID=E0TBU3_PARBH|nr:TIGR00282 family metallophosphoesterase [Parvularcula bermudensis]ADM08436.1 hypothetical protein PB2503_01787 [Parvularcula bermudensis HTCC2503]
MRLGFLGDVMGRAGRNAVLDNIGHLKSSLGIDFLIINVENAAGGFGITTALVNDFMDAGADCLTTGNHAFDQRDDLGVFETEPAMIRPANYPSSCPGRGAALLAGGGELQVLVVQVLGQRFMNPIDDPVSAIERELDGLVLGQDADAIVIDVHAEASSEKYALGHYLDGRVTAVVGSHTHVPTADFQVLPGGTAFHSDAGMCGDYDSVIGMEKAGPVESMVSKMRSGRMVPASGPATICGTVIDSDPKTGLAQAVYPLRLGGRLAETLPPRR